MDANKEPLFKNRTDTVQQIFVVNYSVERLRVVQAELDLDEDVQFGMNNITNVQSLCDIKWYSRANEQRTFKPAFSSVVIAMEWFEDYNHPVAAGEGRP